MSTDFAKLIVQADTTDLALLKDKLSDVEKQSGKTEGSTKKFTASTKELGKELVVVSAAAGGFLAAITKVGADFDKSMTQSLAIMGDVTEEVRDQMSDAAKEVATVTTYSASEAAKAYFYLASAGMDAEQSIGAMPKVAKFAQAGMFDLALATDLLTDAQSALGLSSKDAEENLANMARISDVLVNANILANASVQQFSEALTNKAGAALRVVNKDVEEGVAVLAAFADQGLKGVSAGESLNIVLRDLQRASIDNKQAFEAAGIAVYDQAGNMRNIADIIGELERSLEGMSDEQKRTTFTMLGFQDRSISAMMALLGTSDSIKEYEKELRNAGGITDEVADKQLQNFWDQLKLVGNEFVNVGIDIWEGFEPALMEIIPLLKGTADQAKILASIFTDMPKPIKTATAATFGLVAVAGPSVLIFGKLGTTIKALTGSVKLLNLAMVANPITAVAAALTSVAWAAIEAKKAYDLLGVAKANASKAEDMSREMQELVALKKEIEGTIEQIEQLKGTSFWGPKYEEDLEVANANLESVKKVIQDTNREMQGLPPVTDELSDSTKNLNDETEKVTSNFQNMIDKLQSLSGAEKTESDNQNKLNELMTEGERIRVANLNPMEKLYEEHKKLGKLLDAEAISWTTYDRALKSLEEQHEAYLQSEIDLMTRKEELRQQEKESLYNGLLTQEEEINQFYNRKKKLILESEAVTEAQKQDLLVRLRKDTDNKLLALQEKSNTSNLKSYETMFDGIMGVTSAFGKEQSGFYKTMFVLRQSAALANSLVAIGQGLAESSKVGWPQNIATMAGHIASTAGIITSISSVKFSGKFANGGEIPAGSWGIAGEAGKPEMIQGPAKVISGDDTEDILNRRSGETVINFYDSSGTLVDTFRNKVRSQEFDTVIDDIALRMKERA